MSRAIAALCASLCAFSLCGASADDVSAPQEISALTPIEVVVSEVVSPAPLDTLTAEREPISQAAPAVAAVRPAPKVEAPFKPFTGKIKARKVRVRLGATLESGIVKELSKSELISIVGEKDNFWAIEPPLGVKAYVFRGLVLDSVVEANRVNIRIAPNMESAVIGHLNAGDKIEGVICAANSKWLEIAPPAKTRFYIAKEYVEYAGGPELKSQFDKRRLHAEQLLDAASVVGKAELRKPFDDIDAERINRSYAAIISDYADFPEYIEQAKEALASFQEAYMQKRLNFLEAGIESDTSVAIEHKDSKRKEAAVETLSATDKMKLWEPIEDALYLSWAHATGSKEMREFYEEQKLSGVTLTGIVEPYNSAVKNKPGDYLLRDKDLPVSYVYSTQVNLQDFIGKRVTLIGTPRPNNNFAFPAYFVLSVE